MNSLGRRITAQLTPQEMEFKRLFDSEPAKKHLPYHLENEIIALMLHYPGQRRFYLNRSKPTDFKNRLNRAIFDAMGKISEPVNIVKIYEHLKVTRMARRGVVEHLAMLNGLIGTDNPFPMLGRSCPLRDGAGGDGGTVPTFPATSTIQG